MSSAIIFINKLGVAVASDSAVTVGDRKAIFNTAQKIFPIGHKDKAKFLAITINNTYFMGVPVELLLKNYSHSIQQNNSSKISIEEYIQDFIRYIEEHQVDLAFKDNEKKYFRFLFEKLFNEMFTALRDEKENQSHIPINKVLESFFLNLSNRIKQYNKDHSSLEPINQIQHMVHKDYVEINYPGLVESVFRESLAEFYNNASNMNLDPTSMPLNEVDTLLLDYYKTFIYESLSCNETYNDYQTSGIYFVGYGEKDLYPSYWGIKAYGFLNGKFVYENDFRRTVKSNDPSHFKTLAQDDSVLSFLVNINTNTRVKLMDTIKETAKKTASVFSNNNPASREFIQNFSMELDFEFDRLGYFESFEEEGTQNINTSLSVMGVMDMAEYAENLISLQSLKRKYELSKENNATVGGPTDVAIITKFEGFKWIKSKSTNS